MKEERFYVLEKMPDWKEWHVVSRAIALGVPYMDAVFTDEEEAGRFKFMVANARPDSKFRIKKVVVT